MNEMKVLSYRIRWFCNIPAVGIEKIVFNSVVDAIYQTKKPATRVYI